MKKMTNMKKLTCQVLAACVLTTELLLLNGGVIAYAETKEASNQSVTASGDHTSEDPVYGGNVLLVTDASGNVGIANGNTLTIEGGSFSQPDLAGGNVEIGDTAKDTPVPVPEKPYTGSGQANNNTLNVNAGSFSGSLYGGHVNIVGYAASNAAAANGNTVTILTAEKIQGAVSGGNVHIKGGTAQADGNIVEITGGNFGSQSNSDISGGRAESVGDNDLGVTGGNAQANGNRVVVNDITIKVNDTGTGDKDKYLTRSIYGGYATAGSGPSAVANNNSVTINGGNIELFPSGVDGYSESNIYAGYATNGTTSTASNNTLTINGGNITCYDGAGETNAAIGGGYATDGAIGNKVIISGGTFGADGLFVHVYGGNSFKLAQGNEVIIAEKDGNTVIINGNVFGGYGNSPNSTMEGNRVVLSAGTVNGKVAGGWADGAGTVKGNEILITGGTIKDNVYGGYAYCNPSIVKNNTAIIAGGKIKGDVFGAYLYDVDDLRSSLANNTVVLGAANGSGVADIEGNVYVQAMAKYVEGEGYTPEARSGGNLNVYNTGNTVDKNVYAEGANINFFVKAGEDEDTARLIVSGKAYLDKANVRVNVPQQLGVLDNGTSYNLFGGTIDGTPASATITDGFIDSRTNLDIGTGKVALDHANDTANESSKSPVETQVVGVAMVNSVMDMTAGQGFSEAAKAVNAEKGDNAGGSSMAPFATFGGSNMRQNSGSYVDMHTWNIGLGFAKEVTNSKGKLLFGPILEYGKGSYDSHLDNGVQGDGDSRIWGVGGMLKQENKDGVYYEGSLRAGRLKSDYQSAVAGGASYENSATFFALHAGAGKVVRLNEDDRLDYYGKVFYTRQGSSSATLSSGHIYDFHAINSVRTRLGLRYNHALNKNQDVYTGLAWQHEFDSKAGATFHSGPYSFSAPAPSVKGETGIFELGMKLKPTNGNYETDLGFIGAFGKQRGLGFNAQFQWNF